MACDTMLKPRQSLTERKAEVKKVISVLDKLIAVGQVNVRVGTDGMAKGAVAFKGWSDTERDGVSDACALRLLLVSGSAQTKLKLMQAQQMAGQSFNRQTLAHGVHSHDGGNTWHKGH